MTDGNEGSVEDEKNGIREAFSILAHDVRLDIVSALLDDWHAVYTEPRTYSELMDAVGMQDSGRFNYHLERLRGVYVERVEDGYVPTASATALYRTILAHRPTETNARTQLDVDADCPNCDTALVGRYERGFLTVACPTCDVPGVLTYPFPANGLQGRTGNEAVCALEHRVSYEIGLARTGQCPHCAGTACVEIQREFLDGKRFPRVDLSCTTCSWHVDVGILQPLLFEPDVVTTLVAVDAHPEQRDDHDADVPQVTGRVQSDEPFRAEIGVESEVGSATIVVDEDLDVIATTVA